MVSPCILRGSRSFALIRCSGGGSKPVPATAERPADVGQSMSSALAHRIEEGWDLATRRPIPTSRLFSQ
jgi:hypothetical protein